MLYLEVPKGAIQGPTVGCGRALNPPLFGSTTWVAVKELNLKITWLLNYRDLIDIPEPQPRKMELQGQSFSDPKLQSTNKMDHVHPLFRDKVHSFGYSAGPGTFLQAWSSYNFPGASVKVSILQGASKLGDSDIPTRPDESR